MISTGYKMVKNKGHKVMKDDIVPTVATGTIKANSKVNDIKHSTEETIKDYKTKANQTIKHTEKQ